MNTDRKVVPGYRSNSHASLGSLSTGMPSVGMNCERKEVSRFFFVGSGSGATIFALVVTFSGHGAVGAAKLVTFLFACCDLGPSLPETSNICDRLPRFHQNIEGPHLSKSALQAPTASRTHLCASASLKVSKSGYSGFYIASTLPTLLI